MAGEGLRKAEVERAVEARLTEVMASGGMTADRLALELLFMLPPGFRDAYAETFHKALAGADGGAGARGDRQAAAGALGRARGAARGSGRRYKRGWTVADEHALSVKERADRRLRALGREMRDELETGERPRGRAACGACRRYVDRDWRFCPTCGKSLEER